MSLIHRNEDPTPPQRRRKKPSKRKISAALTKVADRTLSVDPRDIEAYVPTELDVRIAEAMLAGNITFKDIAEQVQVAAPTISKRMKDPLICAWVSRQVQRNIAHRLGMIDTAMFNRAVGGDVRAADLLYKRFDQVTKRSLHLHVRAGMDFEKLSDDDLEALVKSTQKQEAEIIDVTPKPIPGSSEPVAGSDDQGVYEEPERTEEAHDN